MKRLIFIVGLAALLSGIIFYYAADVVRKYINAIYGTPPESKFVVTPLVQNFHRSHPIADMRLDRL